MTIYIIMGVIIIVASLGFVIFNNFLKLKELDTVSSISEKRLEEALIKKKELLNKLKDDTKNKDLIKLMNIADDLNIFDLEKALYEIKWSLNKLIEEKKLKTKEETTNILNELNKVEEEIEGLKDYYNSKAITYNERYFKKPFHLLFKIFKYQQKKTFSLRKIEEYEILKD